MKKLYRLMEKIGQSTYKEVSKSYNLTNIKLRKDYFSKVYPTKLFVIL